MKQSERDAIIGKARKGNPIKVLARFFVMHKLLYPMILGGLLTGLTVIFPQLWLVEWVSMIPIFYGFYQFCAHKEFSLKRAYAYGFFTVFFYHLVIYHWFLKMYPMDFVGLTEEESLFVVILGWIGLPLLQAIPGGLMFLFAHWLERREVFARFPFLRPITLPILWVILEWLSTVGWTGVPLGRLCLGQIQCLPILQSASLFGPYFVSFLLLLVNSLLAYALCVERKRVLFCALSGAILFGSLGYGLVRMPIRKHVRFQDENTVSVAVVQGNLSVYESWDDGSYRLMKEVHANLTRNAVADGAEIVIWPETTFPYVLSESPDLQGFVSMLARECKVTLIIGALDSDDDGNDYNVLYFVEPNGTIREDTYVKRRLVPFGEYVPMGDLFAILLPPLADMMALGAGLTAGEDASLFRTEHGNAGALICYDSIYETLTRDSVRNGAEWMIIASNDSWFRNSKAVDLHQAQAQLRAIESGRYVASAVNTGISSVITPEGEIIGWLEKDVDGYAIAKISARQDMTLYMLVGNVFVYLCMLVCLGLFMLGIFLKRNRHRKNAAHASFVKMESNAQSMETNGNAEA